MTPKERANIRRRAAKVAWLVTNFAGSLACLLVLLTGGEIYYPAVVGWILGSTLAVIGEWT